MDQAKRMVLVLRVRDPVLREMGQQVLLGMIQVGVDHQMERLGRGEGQLQDVPVLLLVVHRKVKLEIKNIKH
jgi:hypothetical protein